MRRGDERHWWSPVSVWAVLLAVVMVATPLPAQEPEEVTLRGEVEAAEYDDDGDVTQVAVYDGEWGSVLVSKNAKGSELLNHIGATVSATGSMRELDDDSGYAYIIEIETYTIEESSEPDRGKR